MNLGLLTDSRVKVLRLCIGTACCILSLAAASSIPVEPRATHDTSSLKTDTLPNGLRYYIQKNDDPKDRVELRLIVNTGSAQEDPDQLGFAHFLEHMAFNGTRHFPGLALIDFVEAAGMTFGTHLNAYTSFDETVYKLAVPTDDPKFLQQSLQILEDWANGGILIDSTEVVAERGVVLGEWRSKVLDTAQHNAQMHIRSTLFGKTSTYVTHLPIGDPELLKVANAGAINRFYHDWYRPNLMSVVIVGDIDPVQVEQEVIRRFGSIKNPVPVRQRPVAKVRNVTQPTSDVFSGAVPPNASVYWNVDRYSSDPRAGLEQRIVEDLLLGEVNTRYFSLLSSQGRPFVTANVGTAAPGRAFGPVYNLSVIALPDSLLNGLKAAIREIAYVSEHGISDAALERQKEGIRHRLERSAELGSPINSGTLAERFVNHYLSGEELLLMPQQRLQLTEAILPGISTSTIRDAARAWLSNKKRTVQITFPMYASVRPPTEAEINSFFDSVKTASTATPSVKVDSRSDTDRFKIAPNPGTIVREEVSSPAGVVRWTLSNGATVLYKQSDNNPDEILLRAHSLGGSSLLPDSLFFSPGRMVGMLITAASGFGGQNRQQFLQQQSANPVVRDFKVALNYGDEEISLNGSSTAAERLFQFMYLTFTDPTLDTAAVSAWKQYGIGTLGGSPNDQLAWRLSLGNPRLAPPSPALMQLFDLDQAMAVFKDRFGDASDFTFTIVGALSPEDAKAMVTRYIASLPSTNRAVRERPVDPKIKSLQGKIESYQNVLPVQKAHTTYIFDRQFDVESDDYLTMREQLSIVTWITSRRLRNEMRERLSATYGVGVTPAVYRNPNTHHAVTIEFDTDPNVMDSLTNVLEHQLDSLRQFGATDQELTLATEARYRGWQVQLQNNQYWLSAIQDYDYYGIPFDRIMDRPTLRMTPSDVKVAAERFMAGKSFIHVTQLPKDYGKKKTGAK